MQVVILCGGLGTRLREETEFKPKPRVAIGSRPILWHIMKLYASYGYRDFVLALGYKGDSIKNYFCHYELMNNDVTVELGKGDPVHIHQSHEESGWKVTLANTGEKTLKGGRLKKVEKYLTGDTFMLTYGDGVGNIDIPALVAFHRQHGRLATITGINPPSRFGQLNVSGSQVTAFSEKPVEGEGVINGGFFIFNRKILDYLTDDELCDLEVGPLEKIASEGQLMVYKHKGFWACMDTQRDMEYLNRLWAENRAEWKIWQSE